MTTVEGIEIPMTKDWAVVWRQYEVESRAGVLLLSPECDPATSEVLTHHPDYMPPGKTLGDGREGIVFAPDIQPNVAIKTFTKPFEYATDFHGTLADLRLAVVLNYGLPQIEQPNEYWRLRAPRMLGAFLPEEALTFPVERDNCTVPSLFAMERIRPAIETEEAITLSAAFPNAYTRKRLIQKAAGVYGLTDVRHDSDDCQHNNLMIERLPGPSGRGSIVTYDNYCRISTP